MIYYSRSLRLSIQYISKYPIYWLWMFLRALYVVSEVCLPIILGHIINVITRGGFALETFAPWAILYIVLQIINPVVEVWTGNRAWVIGKRIGHDFRADIVLLLKHTGLGFWQKTSRGSVMKVIDKAAEDFGTITSLLSHTYLWIIGRVIGVMIASSFIDPIIFIIYLIDTILFFINLRIMLPIEDKRGITERKGYEGIAGGIMQYLQNFKTVVYLNLFARQERELIEKNDEGYNKYYQREVISSWKWYFNNQLHNIATVIVFGYGLWQVYLGSYEIGTLATLMIFSNTYAETMGWLVWQSDQMIQYVNSMQRYFETFDEIKPDPHALDPSNEISFKSLSLKNVSLQRENRETLRDVTLDIHKGDKLALVGYTGSGKSTLVDLVLKVNTKYKGTISINDHDYKTLNVRDISSIFSIVPQEVQLFHDSIKNNILASNEAFKEPLDEVIYTSGLTELVARLPKGLNTVISENSTNISGGERQRIGIARSLVQDQPVLVLDEATASLDPKTEREVITRIVEKYPDQTMIYITHKYSLLNLFDHIAVMSDGRIVESGSFTELVNRGGLFKDLYEASIMQ